MLAKDGPIWRAKFGQLSMLEPLKKLLSLKNNAFCS
jgi:hypothetical protein